MKTKLKTWVSNIGGPKEAGARLGVSEHTVRYWTKGRGSPTTTTMMKIEKLTRGRVSMHDIILESRRKRKNK